MPKPTRRQRELPRTLDRVLTIREFAKLNHIHRATLLRAIARGEGPRVIQLSERRIGIRESDGAAWQAARVRA